MRYRLKLSLTLIILLIIVAGCVGTDKNESSEDKTTDESTGELEHNPPSMDDLDPEDPKTDAILYGEEVFNETNVVMPEHVGNELSCQSCHADGGRSLSSSMVGVTTDYPQYRPREGIVFTLEDRVNGCMIRSMNGEMIDSDTEEMRALIAYMTYISTGIEVGADRPWAARNTMPEVPEPDVDSGRELFESKNCLTCHAVDGAGTGANSGPALWGEKSFNDGAGMGRITKMAGYIQNNMPIGEEFELSDQEAADLAAYLLMHDRPVFEGHDEDFPHGGRPTDIITEERRQLIQEGKFDWTKIENVIPKDNKLD